MINLLLFSDTTFSTVSTVSSLISVNDSLLYLSSSAKLLFWCGELLLLGAHSHITMARNTEKAMTALARWRAAHDGGGTAIQFDRYLKCSMDRDGKAPLFQR